MNLSNMKKRIGELLLERGLIDQSTLDTALNSCRSNGMRIGEFLIAENCISEDKFYEVLSKQFDIPYICNLSDKIDKELIRSLPSQLFKEYRWLPLYSNEEYIGVVVSDPLDLDIILSVESVSRLIAETSLTTPGQLQQVCRELFKGESCFKNNVVKISKEFEKQLQNDESKLSLEDIRKNVEAEPVVKMATLIFDEAIQKRASDIHIEPSETSAMIRFRIDGMLRPFMELNRWMFSPLTSRIKILAELDIAEKRLPQDGRIRYSFDNQLFDFRISTLPTHYGEKTVIRILKHDLSLLDLENLGIESKELQLLSEAIEKPQGIIFVTGPTGSGKSSTLFACLNRIKGKEINITTIENPIEYKLDGINQVQINEKAGVTFSGTLRSILRQDPDVILVGEIRDRETAEIAIQASQTGHLVFSTLHTNDAVAAIVRLKDLGIPGFLISSSLLAIVAQRLVRVLCPDCRKKEVISDEFRLRWSKTLGDLPFNEAWYPVGCNKCGNNGFLGRKGIFEFILVNDEIRKMITENSSESQIKTFLRKNNFHSMVHCGIEKIKQGITTPEEVLRVVLVDDIVE